MAEQPLNKDQIGQLRERAKESMYFFSKAVLGYDWLTPHIHGPLCRDLQDPSCLRKKIVLPRGWLKSTLCSISYPLWCGVRDPNIRILIVMNNHTNAEKKLAELRGHLKGNKLLRALFPEVLPTKHSISRSNAVALSRTKSHPEATFECVGTRTQVTSRHYNKIIEDDTIAPDLDEMGEEALAPSQEDVAKAIGWHRLTLPLLTDPSSDEILVVGTRWFDKDLMSWIDENEPHYKVIERSCREDDEGRSDPNGKITYPERFDADTLDQLKAAMGPYLFAALYLNNPTRSEDMVFLPEWFKYYDREPLHLVTYTTVDVATDPEEAQGNATDYNVVMTCGKDLRTGHVYVLDYFHEKCNPGRLIQALFDHVRKWSPVKVGIETVAYQKSLLYWIRERMRHENCHFWIEGLTHGRKSKGSRIQALQPVVANGTLVFRTWMKELVQELEVFPLGAHDDLADALSMQLQMWQTTVADPEREDTGERDPLSLDRAIQELEGRQRESRGHPADDLVHAPSALTF